MRTVAFDKTGTLTAGRPQLSRRRRARRAPEDEALALAAAVERRSEHPLAQALVARRPRPRPALAEPDAFEALPGRGVIARVDGRELWAGGPRLAAERLGAIPDARGAARGSAGRPRSVLGEGDRALAVFGLADQPRPEAAARDRRAAPRRRRRAS